ncbi:MAG: hypothetical protein RQ753_03375, partial [Desulfurivibrionaceae bacterium]|nr:hypothetical protein [Desulfurivibrionaceae bacterium]
MARHEELTAFYRNQLPDGVLEGTLLKAPCPFCGPDSERPAGRLLVSLDERDFFTGYFRCLNRCVPGGFAPHFGRLLGLDPSLVPGHDPERRTHPMPKDLPGQGINQEIDRLHSTLTPEMRQYFAERTIGPDILRELKIGFNGRYLIYPYFRENDLCYAAHCRAPERDNDHFWLGDAGFAAGGLQIFNLKDIDRCEDGALFLAEGEANLLCLRELGYPGVAVPGSDDLETLDPESYQAMRTGLEGFDRAMGGVHGLNVIGGPPKSGKSCLAIQLATEIAARRMPVI